jgi:hypothetical protein
MRLSNRLVVLLFAGGALVGAAWSQPDLAAGLGLSSGGGERQEQQNRQRRAELDRHDGIVLRRIMAKEAIVKDLLEGRLTLLEAAQRFQDLDEKSDERLDQYRLRYPGRSDGEKRCRQVIDWVRTRLEDRPPSQAAALLQRLEEELNDILCLNGGAFALPEA